MRFKVQEAASEERQRMLKKAWGKLKSVTGKNLDRFRGRQAIRGGLFKEIDLEALKALGKNHEGHNTQKYEKRFEHSLIRNAERIFRLQLHKTKGRRILDLGCGFGYFMYGAKKLGHYPVGLDVPDPYLSEVTNLLGLKKVVHRIEPFQPLPAIEGGPFDLITAFAIMFDSAARPSQWDVKEWKFFLGDLKRFMAPNCLLHFKFNQYVGPGCKTGIGCRVVPNELREYFQSIGGKFDKRTMQIANAGVHIG